MQTVQGIITDATGAVLNVGVTFLSQSTPLVSGEYVTGNTSKRIMSRASDGFYSLQLAAGYYLVTYETKPNPTSFTILVPSGTSTSNIGDLVTSPIQLPPGTPPYLIWNGVRAGHITFQPQAAPAAPTITQVAYTGGHTNDVGAEKYSYFVTYVTATGETTASPQANFEDNLSATPNSANRITLVPNVAGVTSVRIWRYPGDGSHYFAGSFPTGVGLVATVTPQTAYYDDWMSPTQFSAAYDPTVVGPLYNTTAGELISTSGVIMAVADGGVYFPGTNCRVKPGVGFQIYNFDTSLWYTLLVAGSPAALGLDGGNPN